MPKETFNNLSEDKKERIMEAARKEFSLHPLHEASVANIIKDLGISRGSFYKYFENLEELYIYFYHKVKIDFHQLIFESIAEKKGDLFAGLELFFERMVHKLLDDEYAAYFKMTFTHMDYEIGNKLTPELYATGQHHQPTTSDQLIASIQMDRLKLKSEVELFKFIKMLMSILHELLNEALTNDWSKEKILAEFQLRMNWLRNGLEK
ncbi:TetR/AcrR family transcriptional regulator [Isobaculum melis]|uniref:Regulatory protein, tetR family n=1 Tax=Isobaculum melis TaxID=142588 RepID=A0A1H9S6Q3_9LACT|nr:TetR/AcrR family transcriptional regulator [Isobaculum melis]SER80726.1 regulatory protein, tetR family [Isobaculum melis]